MPGRNGLKRGPANIAAPRASVSAKTVDLSGCTKGEKKYVDFGEVVASSWSSYIVAARLVNTP